MRELPMCAVYAFLAGHEHHAAQVSLVMARNATSRDNRAFHARCARGAHHTYLTYRRMAADAAVQMRASGVA